MHCVRLQAQSSAGVRGIYCVCVVDLRLFWKWQSCTEPICTVFTYALKYGKKMEEKVRYNVP